MLVRFILLLFIVCNLSSCFSNNKKLTQDESFKQSNKDTQSIDNPVPQPISLQSGGNLIINNPIFYDTEKTLKIRTENDRQSDQAYSFYYKVFNPWTFLLFGFGIISIVVGVKMIKNMIMNSSIGGGLRVFTSVFDDISSLRKENLDPTKDEILKQFEAKLLQKYNKLLKK